MNDNLGLIMYALKQAREQGNIDKVLIGAKTLRELTFSPSIDIALEMKGLKATKPYIIDQGFLEFLLDAKIELDLYRDGIQIQISKEIDVTWE